MYPYHGCALQRSGCLGGELFLLEIQAFPLGFELPQTIKIYNSQNVQHGSSWEAFESHQIVFKMKCVLKHKLELGGFGCL
jgi:hypothetical protein